MSILADLKMYGRFAWGLREFLRHTISLEEAKAIVQKRMAERKENFLRLVRKGIFEYPKSPYLPLLKLARCEMGDIEKMVRDKGLEGTLRALREAGIYITFEEFKGREPMVRSGKVFPVKPHDFDNPYLKNYYEGTSGGSTGAGTRVAFDLDHLIPEASRMILAYDAHGILNAPMAFWYGILPDHTGINNMLRNALSGHVAKKWFSPITRRDFKPPFKSRLATQYTVGMARFLGVPIPWPELVPLDQASVVARWAAKTLETQGNSVVRTHVSMAVRVCVAAREEGLNLKGVTFMGGGEPPTPAKVQEITRTGARWIPTYFFAEAGAIGFGCANPVDGNDLHFFKDTLALIQYPRKVPGSEIPVDAFYFTTLIPEAHKLMLNVESDDCGIIENRSCDCPLDSYGFTEHLRHIHSLRKLTGEGVTIAGSEMVRILEEVLPARFGGSSLDYQLVEEEDEHGFTRLSLLVSPRIKILDEAKVIETVLEALGKGSVSADMGRAIWTQAGTLRVKRMEPIWTARGRLRPLYTTRRTEHLSSGSFGSTSASQDMVKSGN